MLKLTLTIEKLNSEGAGLARHEGKVYFIPWTVPGDTVLVQVEKEHRDYSEARLLEIKERSPDRIDPLCPYFYKCGGCQLQHMSYEAQLKWKKEIVRDALKRIARIANPQLEPIIASPKIWNYRSRIQLHQDRQGKIGFYKHHSHEVVPIEKCLIADERLNEKIVGTPFMAPTGAINRAPTELRVDNSTGFIQTNTEQNQVLINQVLEQLTPTKQDLVFDLFCGSGNFTFPLSKLVKEVWGIEKSSASIEEAKAKTLQEKADNIIWVEGGVLRLLSQLKKEGIKPNKILVDPPRRGLAEVLDGILSFKPERIVYVSCNPATLARDASIFLKKGYSLSRCQPIDMFPQAAHLEIVSLFSWKNH